MAKQIPLPSREPLASAGPLLTGRYARLKRKSNNWVAEVVDVVDGRVVASKESERDLYPQSESRALDAVRYTQDVADGTLREDS